MKRLSCFLLLTALAFSACKRYSKYEGVPFTEKEPRDWENPGVFSQNREKPHATLISYQDENSALTAERTNSPNWQSLDGKWKFHWVNTPGERPFWFFKDDYDIRDWDDTDVPSNWQRKGYDVPIYVNIGYGFKKDPPRIAHEWNPVGSYKRTFKVPSDWKDKEIFLHFGAVSSAFYVWVNEQLVGYSQDSKLPAEFNITKYLRRGKNSLSVEVYRWSDGSYLEDQDFWRLSGIQRSVYLHARPENYIRDFFAKGMLENNYSDGKLELNVELAAAAESSAGLLLEAVLFDGEQKIYSESKEIDVKSSSPEAVFSKQFPGIKKWSAEKPDLYTLVLNLRDRDGANLESVSAKIGFRSVEIKDSQLHINGVPVRLKGTNLHEHHDIMGHVV
nr:beta-galactosidase [Bacteroidales bacterium]